MANSEILGAGQESAHRAPVNEHIGYVCPDCGEFFGFNEYEAMRCCGTDKYICRYKRISDGAIFDL